MKHTTLTKWIERAEARTVCEFALTETRLANFSTVRRAGDRTRAPLDHVCRLRAFSAQPDTVGRERAGSS